ncbi:hypothetical protein MMC07_006410 [Pseudocyphellaria aurata]|nr:hypothetical protein [Pseudocyphellaria aurata]
MIASSTVYLGQDELRTLGIERSDMDLRPEDKPDSGPRFGIPFPSDAFDQALEKAFDYDDYEDGGRPEWYPYEPDVYSKWHGADQLADLMLKYLGCRSLDNHLIASTKWDRQGVHTRVLPFLMEFYESAAEEWGVIEILRIPANYQSHLACVMIDGAAADDRLRRSELICAVQYIMRGILLDKLDEFLVNPVFVYSFSDRDARIIQAHFDGSHLIVRTTPYLNFEEKNEENIKLFLRWMMCEPTGPTKFGIEDGHLCAVTPEPMEIPLDARIKTGRAYLPRTVPKIVPSSQPDPPRSALSEMANTPNGSRRSSKGANDKCDSCGQEIENSCRTEPVGKASSENIACDISS